MNKQETILKLAEMMLSKETTEKTNSLDNYMVGKYCIARTYSAGVHIGVVKAKEGQTVILENSRRLWSWEGAFTLSKVAVAGFKDAKMPVAVPEIQLERVIELIPVADSVRTKIENWKVHNE